MEVVRRIQFHAGTREELLPGFSPEFPYISTRAEIDRYEKRFVPWHWHRAVELFYMQSGTLEYYVPGKHLVFPTGSGGFVNSNVLHMTRTQQPVERVTQLLHIFDPALIAGEPGSRIEQKYVMPLVTSAAFDIFFLDPDDPAQAQILMMMQEAFSIPERDGRELRVRNAMSDLWLALWEQMAALPPENAAPHRSDDTIKHLMTYIYEHYAEKISIEELAAAAYLSKRECFRVFRERLHTSPGEYIREYRLQMACRMLTQTAETVSAIGYACGLGSGSYFGKTFRESLGCTPLEYRQTWQDRDRIGR